MKTKLILVLAIAFLLGTFSLLAEKIDVTGKWEITSQSPRGERTRTVEMKQNGEELVVISESRNGDKIESKGTVKGNKIEWSFTRETPRGTFTMSYSGVVEGDTIKGEMQMGDFGSREWTAKKVKEENK